MLSIQISKGLPPDYIAQRVGTVWTGLLAQDGIHTSLLMHSLSECILNFVHVDCCIKLVGLVSYFP